MTLGVVLLAAGASSRMGRPKLLLPWGTTSVLGHLLEQWRALDAVQIGVVGAPANVDLLAALDRLGFPCADRIINPAPEMGMFGSIRCAAAWTGWDKRISHWAISLGDQPEVRLETLWQLISFTAKNRESICQPSSHGRPRHPVLMPANYFRELPDTTAENLKAFLQAREQARKLVAVDDPGLDHDLDSPADYESAKERFLKR